MEKRIKRTNDTLIDNVEIAYRVLVMMRELDYNNAYFTNPYAFECFATMCKMLKGTKYEDDVRYLVNYYCNIELARYESFRREHPDDRQRSPDFLKRFMDLARYLDGK